MIVISINNIDYRIFQDWSEITVSKARQLAEICKEIPSELNEIYKQQSKGKDSDKDQIALHEKSLSKKDLLNFQTIVLECLSDIPRKVIKATYKGDVSDIYNNFLVPFVFGCLYFPVNVKLEVNEFTICGETYYAPDNKELMGVLRHFFEEDAAVFCDASDVDMSCRKSGNKYAMAELIIAIVFREKKDKYNEKTAMYRAEKYKDIVTMDVYNAAIFHLSKVNSTLKQLFPNLYQKGDMKSSHASERSGLNDFGWLNSIMTVAEMGVLNQNNLTPLESVRQTNLYDFMTILSNLRASSDFKRIFQEQQNKKK